MKYFDLSLDRFQVWDGFFVGFFSRVVISPFIHIVKILYKTVTK